MKRLDTMFPLALSNSSMSASYSCEFKFFRASIQKLRNNSTNGDLLAGGAFASACELARIDYYNKGLSEEEAVENAVEFILMQPDTGHAIKSNERLALTFRRYAKQFPFSSGFKPCTLEDGSHAIEYTFNIDLGIPHPDLPDRNVMFTGKLDGLYEHVVNGQVLSRYVLDEKTTGRLSRIAGTKVVDLEKETDQFRVSGQMIGYAVAAGLLGIKVDTALIRKVPILTTHEPAFELEIPITKYMKKMWLASVQNTARDMVEKYKYYRDNAGINPQEVFYPTYGSSCTAWNRPCSFMAGCQSKDGSAMVESMFNQLISVEQEDGSRVNVPLEEYRLQYGVGL